MDYFRRGQRVQLEIRITSLHRAEQIFVPRERQVGIMSTLQQQLDASDRDGLVDFSEQLVEAEDVALRGSDFPVERAEVTFRNADVGVVDVPVDDVGDDAARMFSLTDVVGELAKHRGRRRAIQLERFGRVDAATRPYFLNKVRNRHGRCEARRRTSPSRAPSRSYRRFSALPLPHRQDGSQYYRVNSD